jgi:hypothetical protein
MIQSEEGGTDMDDKCGLREFRVANRSETI